MNLLSGWKFSEIEGARLSWALVNPQGVTLAFVEGREDSAFRFSPGDLASSPQFVFTTKWCAAEMPHPGLFSSPSLRALGEALVEWTEIFRDRFAPDVEQIAMDRDRSLFGDVDAPRRVIAIDAAIDAAAQELVDRRGLARCAYEVMPVSSWLSAPETAELRRASRELHLTMPTAWDGYELMDEAQLRAFVAERLGPRYDAATIQLGKFMVEISLLNPTELAEREAILQKLISSLGDENSSNVAQSVQWLEYLAVISGEMTPLLMSILEERQEEFERVMSDFYEWVCKSLGYELKDEYQATGYVALVRAGSSIVESGALRALGLSNEKWLWHGKEQDSFRWSEPSYALWQTLRDMIQPRELENASLS